METIHNETSATERWSAFLGGKSNNNGNNGNDFISFNGNLVPQGRLTKSKGETEHAVLE